MSISQLVSELKPELKRLRSLANNFDEHDTHEYISHCHDLLKQLGSPEDKLMQAVKEELLT